MAVYTIRQSQKYKKLSKAQIKKRRLQPLNNKHDGYIEAFLKENVSDIAVFKFIKQNQNLYPNGLYCVLDRSEIYAVFPFEKDKRLFADHLTFMDGNVHMTTYTPQPLCIDYGVVLHIPKCNVPDGVKMPLTGYDCRLFAHLDVYQKDILDIYRQPHLRQVGGTRRVVRRNRYTDIAPKLEQLLLRNHISELKLFCIRSGDSRWNVTILTKWTRESEENENGSFVVRSKHWSSVQRGLIEHLMR